MAGGRNEHKGPSDSGCDGGGVAVHGKQLAAGLLDPCRSDAAHRVHHRAELADAGDTDADIREALRHAGAAAGPGRGAIVRA